MSNRSRKGMFPSGVAPLPFSKRYVPSLSSFLNFAITYVPEGVLRNIGEPGSEYTSSDDLSNNKRVFSLFPGETNQVLTRRVLYHDSYISASESSHQLIPLQRMKTWYIPHQGYAWNI